jgi:hypothetical protein
MNLFTGVKTAICITFALNLFVLLGQPAVSQVPSDPDAGERKAVLKVVQEFFDTMASKDVDGARRILIPEGRFHSIREQEGKQVIRTFTNEEYLGDLSEGKNRLRERMWSPEVHIRGFIATVWTPYDFWIDDELSHCGVDSFNLIKTGGKWKISGGVYTVERKCKPSPLGPLKKKDSSRHR